MFSCMKLYGLPGGEQVDGLPPAASRLDRRASCSLKVIRLLVQLVGLEFDYGLFHKFGEVFLKKLSFSCISNLI